MTTARKSKAWERGYPRPHAPHLSNHNLLQVHCGFMLIDEHFLSLLLPLLVFRFIPTLRPAFFLTTFVATTIGELCGNSLTTGDGTGWSLV